MAHDGIKESLLVECLAQMAMHYPEQQKKERDASAEVVEPTTDASDGQSETDRCSYDSTAQFQTQAGGGQ